MPALLLQQRHQRNQMGEACRARGLSGLVKEVIFGDWGLETRLFLHLITYSCSGLVVEELCFMGQRETFSCTEAWRTDRLTLNYAACRGCSDVPRHRPGTDGALESLEERGS